MFKFKSKEEISKAVEKIAISSYIKGVVSADWHYQEDCDVDLPNMELYTKLYKRSLQTQPYKVVEEVGIRDYNIGSFEIRTKEVLVELEYNKALVKRFLVKVKFVNIPDSLYIKTPIDNKEVFENAVTYTSWRFKDGSIIETVHKEANEVSFYNVKGEMAEAAREIIKEEYGNKGIYYMSDFEDILGY